MITINDTMISTGLSNAIINHIIRKYNIPNEKKIVNKHVTRLFDKTLLMTACKQYTELRDNNIVRHKHDIHIYNGKEVQTKKGLIKTLNVTEATIYRVIINSDIEKVNMQGFGKGSYYNIEEVRAVLLSGTYKLKYTHKRNKKKRVYIKSSDEQTISGKVVNVVNSDFIFVADKNYDCKLLGIDCCDNLYNVIEITGGYISNRGTYKLKNGFIPIFFVTSYKTNEDDTHE